MQTMQFDHRSSQRVQALPQDTFLPNHYRIKSSNFGRGSLFLSNNAPADGLKKEKLSKWSKDVGGRYKKVPVTLAIKKVEEAKPVLKPKESKRKRKSVKPKKTKKKSVTENPKPVRQTETKYKCWEFGKKKSFVPPKNNKKNNAAAIQIQRIARGGWQRMQYKIALLQHKLDTSEECTCFALDQIQKRLEAQKAAYLKKMQAKAKKNLEKETVGSRAARDAQDIIAYLRRDNKKLREKNEKLFASMSELKHENDRLEKASEEMAAAFDVLDGHTKQINKVHQHLQEIVPKYKNAVRELEEALKNRQEAFGAEHKVKNSYMNTVSDIVETMEDRCKDSNLVEEIVTYLLESDEPMHKVVNFQGSVTEIEEYSEVTAESEDMDFEDYQITPAK